MFAFLLARLARWSADRAGRRALRALGPRLRADVPLPRDVAARLDADADRTAVEPLIAPRRRS
jgi:hypothetical protein